MGQPAFKLDEVEEDFEWRNFANCSGLADLPDNPFFVEGYGANYPVARLYCSTCPVVVDCLLECVVENENEDDEGMWGCMSPNERRTLVKLLNKGMHFNTGVERIWERQRKRKNGSLVPHKEIWNGWNV